MYIKTGEKRNVKCVRVVRPKILNHGSNALMGTLETLDCTRLTVI